MKKEDMALAVATGVLAANIVFALGKWALGGAWERGKKYRQEKKAA